MKKGLKLATCTLAVVFSISAVGGPQLGPFGVDVVSAATGAATTNTQTAPKTQTTSKPQTTATKVTRVLKTGSKGSEVTLLQTMLNNLGYILKADGIFGKQTLNAVKDYQSKNGLGVDGIVGAKTYEKLSAAAATPATPVEPATPAEPTVQPDVVASASIVDDMAVFEKSIGTDGKWIICTTKDLATDKELVLEGEFKNGKKNADGTDAIQRKIALYTQDDQKNVTARFTLTAPKLTIKSPNARIQSGTFKGDLYVTVPSFRLVDAKIDGNVYFTTQEAKDTFNMDAKSVVTGEKVLMEPDVVTTASLVDTNAAFEKGIGKDGKWITSIVRDLTFNKALLLDGEFTNKEKPARKIALYSQDAQKNITRKFTLTAPTLTINSPSAKLQGGIFKGDLYVSAPNFQLVKAKVEGDVYFTTQEAFDTFVNTEGEITGKQELLVVDAVSTATQVEATDEASLLKAVGKEGAWISIFTQDMTTDKELVLEGFFTSKGVPSRKLALYTQDDKRNVTARFTLTAPKLTIKSPNAKIQNGNFKGDIYVSAKNFQLAGANVEGNIYFTNQAAMDTFVMDAKSSVTGKKELITN